MRISDWSSDVCSSDLIGQALKVAENVAGGFDAARRGTISHAETQALAQDLGMTADDLLARRKGQAFSAEEAYAARAILAKSGTELVNIAKRIRSLGDDPGSRSEEHTTELQSLTRTTSAVFCLQKKKQQQQ